MLKTRAAFDLGSGTIKVQAATMDSSKKQIVGDPLYAKYLPLNLTEDISLHAGYLSEEAIHAIINILEFFKGELAARIPNSIEYSGIATAVFRNAHNGEKALQKIKKATGIPIELCSQEEEGRLGYLTGKALNSAISPNQLVVWDSGYGSFQLTVQDKDTFKVYLGPIGHGSVRIALSTIIRQCLEHSPQCSLNPVSMKEAQDLQKYITKMLPKIPKWLSDKLESSDVHISTFGDIESIFALGIQATNKPGQTWQSSVLLAKSIEEKLPKYMDYDDIFFDTHNIHKKSTTALIFLNTIMQHLGIQKIHFKQNLGNTLGLLICDNFWQ